MHCIHTFPRFQTGFIVGVLATCAALVVPTVQAGESSRKGDFLSVLAGTPGGIVVAYGSESSSLAAAHIIRDAIRRLPGQEAWDRLVPAADFDARDYRQTGPHHVLAVGTLWDNEALRGRDWLPTWWLDRDWYYSAYPFALTPEEMGLPYQSRSGFMAAGFGEWPKGEQGVGLVEVDRSHYFMEWMVRSRLDSLTPEKDRKGNNFFKQMQALKDVESPTYPDDVPLRLLVRITGSGGPGVLAAARAFADNGMLNGVVLAGNTHADQGPPMFTLTEDRYRRQLPFTAPRGRNGYRYQGWLLPSAFQYDGFAFETRLRPRRMIRLKYMPEFGITNFWTTPHRRASQFEICILEFTDNQQAETAAGAMMDSLDTRAGARAKRIIGVNHRRVDNVVFVESIPEPVGERLLDDCVVAWKRGAE